MTVFIIHYLWLTAKPPSIVILSHLSLFVIFPCLLYFEHTHYIHFSAKLRTVVGNWTCHCRNWPHTLINITYFYDALVCKIEISPIQSGNHLANTKLLASNLAVYKYWPYLTLHSTFAGTRYTVTRVYNPNKQATRMWMSFARPVNKAKRYMILL